MSSSPAEPSGQEGTDASSPPARRGFLCTAADATDVLLLDGWASSAASAAPVRVQDGIGSVSTAPRLPAGFTKAVRRRFVEASGIRQHVVVSGDGPRGWCTAGPRTGTPGAS
jgi:hypothetical protein